jgi:hypothetical protein
MGDAFDQFTRLHLKPNNGKDITAKWLELWKRNFIQLPIFIENAVFDCERLLSWAMKNSVLRVCEPELAFFFPQAKLRDLKQDTRYRFVKLIYQARRTANAKVRRTNVVVHVPSEGHTTFSFCGTLLASATNFK